MGYHNVNRSRQTGRAESDALPCAGFKVVDLDLGSGQQEGGPNPMVVEQIWSRFKKAEVDWFAAQRNVYFPLWFSVAPQVK